MDKQKALDAVVQEIVATGGGPLAAPDVFPVPGEGSPNAEILFIGEAPGYHENEERRPFVGQAGKLLRKTLVVNGFTEAEVYITNIVKFRPPENRDPTPEEIEFFRPLLDKQIEIIDPKIIVTLGRYSMYKFLGVGVSISRIHGQPRSIDWHNRKTIIFPMYHPAAALRQGSVMRDYEEDFRKLKNLVHSGSLPADSTIPSATPSKKVDNKEGEQLKLV